MKKFIIGFSVILFLAVGVFVYLGLTGETRVSLKVLGEERESYFLGDKLELEVVAKNNSFHSHKSHKDYFVTYVEETGSSTGKGPSISFGIPEPSSKDVVLSPFQTRREVISVILSTDLNFALKPRYTVDVVEGVNHFYVEFGDDDIPDSNKIDINVDFEDISALDLEELKCEHSSGDLCYLNLAKDTGDYSYCDEMGKGFLRDSCYMEKFTKMADFSGCDDFEEGLGKSHCYRVAGEVLGEALYCRKITSVDNNSLSHKDSCYMARA